MAAGQTEKTCKYGSFENNIHEILNRALGGDRSSDNVYSADSLPFF